MLAPAFTTSWAIRIIDKVVASSQFIRRQFAPSLPDGRVEVVPPFIRPDGFSSRATHSGTSNQNPRILYLGSHKALRGEEDFLLMMSLLQGEFGRIEGVAITPHPLPERIQRLVKKLGLEGKVTFPSRDVSLDVLSLIESSDLYVFTGLSPIGSIDPPLSIIESLILGTPVVSYDTGGIREILNGSNLVPYQDYASLAKIASDVLNRHAPKQPRPDLLAKFSAENGAKQFEKIYQQLV